MIKYCSKLDHIDMAIQRSRQPLNCQVDKFFCALKIFLNLLNFIINIEQRLCLFRVRL